MNTMGVGIWAPIISWITAILTLPAAKSEIKARCRTIAHLVIAIFGSMLAFSGFILDALMLSGYRFLRDQHYIASFALTIISTVALFGLVLTNIVSSSFACSVVCCPRYATAANIVAIQPAKLDQVQTSNVSDWAKEHSEGGAEDEEEDSKPPEGVPSYTHQ